MGNTLNGLVGMDFVDYGEYAAFLHSRDTFSRFPVAVFIGEVQMRPNCGNGPGNGDFALGSGVCGARYFGRRQRYAIYRGELP